MPLTLVQSSSDGAAWKRRSSTLRAHCLAEISLASSHTRSAAKELPVVKPPTADPKMHQRHGRRKQNCHHAPKALTVLGHHNSIHTKTIVGITAAKEHVCLRSNDCKDRRVLRGIPTWRQHDDNKIFRWRRFRSFKSHPAKLTKTERETLHARLFNRVPSHPFLVSNFSMSKPVKREEAATPASNPESHHGASTSKSQGTQTTGGRGGVVPMALESVLVKEEQPVKTEESISEVGSKKRKQPIPEDAKVWDLTQS